ncbi:HEAT repeat domain-containing protein [bacterium]|nr:MAG: HEAT repeat domain-containing protein [bacterium]
MVDPFWEETVASLRSLTRNDIDALVLLLRNGTVDEKCKSAKKLGDYIRWAFHLHEEVPDFFNIVQHDLAGEFAQCIKSSKHQEVIYTCVNGISYFGEKASRFEGLLADLLNHRGHLVRLTAIRGLASISPRKRDFIPRFLDKLRSKQKGEVNAAIDALAMSSPLPQNAMNEIIQTFPVPDTRDEETLMGVVCLLCLNADKAKGALEYFRTLLIKTNPAWRQYGAFGLICISDQAEDIRPAIKALRSEDRALALLGYREIQLLYSAIRSKQDYWPEFVPIVERHLARLKAGEDTAGWSEEAIQKEMRKTEALLREITGSTPVQTEYECN